MKHSYFNVSEIQHQEDGSGIITIDCSDDYADIFVNKGNSLLPNESDREKLFTAAVLDILTRHIQESTAIRDLVEDDDY